MLFLLRLDLIIFISSLKLDKKYPTQHFQLIENFISNCYNFLSTIFQTVFRKLMKYYISGNLDFDSI